MGKRGSIANSPVVGAVVVLVVAVVLIGQQENILAFGGSLAEEEKCRLSVIASAVDTSVGVGWRIDLFRTPDVNPFHIDCKKNRVRVSNEKINDEGIVTTIPSDSAGREAKLKDFVLGEVASCWRRFGDASDKVYETDTGEGNVGSTNDAVCFACSDVLFGSDFEETTLDDFYGYANEKRRLVGGESYASFLTGGTHADSIPVEKSINLMPNDQYTTVFMIKKLDNENWEKGWKRWIGSRTPVQPIVNVVQLVGRFVNANNLPKPNSGIVDCWIVTEDDEGNINLVETRSDSIGCVEGLNGFSFGKVAEGYSRTSFSPVDLATGNIPVANTQARFPMTVRFIPTRDVFAEGQCERLY